MIARRRFEESNLEPQRRGARLFLDAPSKYLARGVRVARRRLGRAPGLVQIPSERPPRGFTKARFEPNPRERHAADATFKLTPLQPRGGVGGIGVGGAREERARRGLATVAFLERSAHNLRCAAHSRGVAPDRDRDEAPREGEGRASPAPSADAKTSGPNPSPNDP